MPFLRYTRDKRGYEHVYLVQPTTGRKGKVRARILYWYRTPPNVKVGREPFDEDVRRSIEKQYPDVEFDWPKLLATPKPAVANTDIERWRERRRQAKAERAAAAAEAESERADADTSASDAEQPEALEDETPDATAELQPVLEGVETVAPPEAAAEPRRRRRRRKRRGRRPDRPGEPSPAAVAGETPAEPLESAADSDEDEPESE